MAQTVQNREVLTVTADRDVAQSVAAALSRRAELSLQPVCTDLALLGGRMANQPSLGVIVDIDPEPKLAIRQLEGVIAQFPLAKFILLCREVRQDLVMEAMQVGARQVLAKGEVASSLGPSIDRLLRPPAASASGSVVTVFSAAGGCGATTLAINLAEEFVAAGAPGVLMVDMDWSYGSLGTYLGLKGAYGIGDLLARTSQLDEGLVSSGAVAFNADLGVLLSPASVAFGSPLPSCQNLPAALQVCRSAYLWTIVDAPRVGMDVAATLLAASQVSLVVMQPAVKDVHTARQLHQALSARGESSRLATVVNRYHPRRASVPLSDCSRFLGHQPYAVLTNDSKGAMLAATLGQPLAQASPRCALRRDIRQLARRLWSDCQTAKQGNP